MTSLELNIFSPSESEHLKSLLKNPEEDFEKVVSLIERKTNENVEQLRESEEKYRSLFENMNAGFAFHEVIVDDDNKPIDYKYIEINSRFEDFTGLKKENLIGKTVTEAIPGTENDPADWIGKFGSVGLTGIPLIVEEYSEAIQKWFKVSGYSPKKGYFALTFTDINDLKITEQKLKESEKNYRLITENASDLIVILDNNFKYEYINEQVHKRLMGYSKEEIIGKSALDFIHPDDQEEAIKALRKGFNEGEGVGVARIRNKKGDYTWLEIKGKTFKDKYGITKGIMISRDITKRKKAEEKLKESEEKFRLMAEQAVVGIFIIQDYKFPYVNNKLADITGYSVEEMLSWKPNELFKLFHPDDLDFVREQGEKKLRGDLTAARHYQYRCIRKNGEIIWIDHYSKNAQYQGKNAILGVILDITDKMEAAQKIRESEEKFRNISEQSLIGIGIVQDNIVKYVNKKFADIFGYTVEEMLNWSPEEFMRTVHPDDREFVFNQVKKKQAGTEDYLQNYNFRGLKKSGEIIWIENYTKAILYEGKSADFVAFIDITERINAQQEMIKLNQLKTELLRRTSHELKTPLVSIKGFVELLLEVHRDKIDAVVISTLNEIQQGCFRLENLIGDILKTSELESGTIELQKSEEDLSFLVKVCINEIKGFSKLRNHKINLELHEELITHFEKEQIHQVIGNLLNNSVKYTPPSGNIDVKSEIKEDFIILSIKDNGIGFTEEEKTRIFKQFGKIERYGQGLDIIAEGSGFGLFISKKIIELHGGDIWVESEGRNKGSTFYISLPII